MWNEGSGSRQHRANPSDEPEQLTRVAPVVSTGERAVSTLLRALFLWLSACAACSPAWSAGIEIHTLDGQPSSLGAQLQAKKWNILMVWTTHCEVCRAQYPIVSAFHTRHSAHDAVVLGVALDHRERLTAVRDYREAQNHSFPSVLASADGFIEALEGSTGEPFSGTPTYLLFNPRGTFESFVSGPVSMTLLERIIAVNSSQQVEDAPR